MAEEILTIFKADLSELEAAVAKGDKLVSGYEESTQGANSAVGQLGNVAGNASAKVSMLGAATSKTATAAKDLGSESGRLIGPLTKEAAAAEAARANFQKLAAEMKRTVDAKARIGAALKANEAEYIALNKAISDSGIKSDALTKTVEENRRAHEDLSNQLASVAADEVLVGRAFNEASNEMVKTAQAADRAANGQTKLGQAALIAAADEAKFNEESKETIGILGQLKSRIDLLNQKKLSLTDPKAIAATNAELRKVTDQYNKLNTSAPAQGGIRGLFSQLGGKNNGLIGNAVQGLTSAASSGSALGSVFAGLTGPIGIAAAAVVGFIANFSRLDSVKVGLEALGIQFDIIGDRLANFDFRGLFDPATQAKDAVFAASVANALDAIEESQLKVNKANAEAELQITGLNQKLRDRTKTEEERLAIAGQIGDIEADRAATEQRQLQIQVKLQQAINDKQLETLGEVSDANKAALNEREIALLKSKERTVQLEESTERRVNLIIEQGANERNAINAKALAAQEKARADAAKKEEERIQKLKAEAAIEGQIRDITLNLEDEDLKSGLSELDNTLLNTEAKFQALDKTTRGLFDALRQGTGLQNAAGEPTAKAATPEGQEQLAAIAKREGDALRLINAAVQEAILKDKAAFAAKELDLQQDAIDKINGIVREGGEDEIAIINAKYAELLSDAEAFIKDEQALAEARAKLGVAQAVEIADATKPKQGDSGGADFGGVEDPRDDIDSFADLFKTRNQLAKEAGEQEVKDIQDKYAAIREAGDSQDMSDIERAAFNKEVRVQEQADLNDALNEQADEQEEIEKERQERVAAFLLEKSEETARILAKAAEDGTLTAEEFGKALVLIFLDTLEKILLIKALEVTAFLIEKGAETAGLPGAIIGAVAGAVITGVLMAAFSALKSSVSSAYTGDPFVQGREGRDVIPYMLTKGERVVTRDKNKEHWEPLQAIHEGRFDKWLDKEFQGRTMDVPYELIQSNPLTPYLLNTDMQLMHSVNAYMEGDTGQRLAQSIMFPKYFDQNMVKSMERGNEEMKTNNKLLSLLVESTKKNQRHARSW